jgi:hypothetical protein
MASLRLHPRPVQQQVEDELVAWLFDDLPEERMPGASRHR